MICRCSSVVEHFLGKEEVDSSILFNGSETIERTKTGVWSVPCPPKQGVGGNPVQRLQEMELNEFECLRQTAVTVFWNKSRWIFSIADG